jgi:HK97 family phage portal protein
LVPFRFQPDKDSAWQQWYYHRPTKTALPGADVIHLQQLGHDGMAAMDPVALHEGTFQRAATLEKYQVEYLRKGTVIRGAVEVPGHLEPEQLAEFRAVLRAFRGPDGEDDVLILTDAAKLNNATTDNQKSQLMEQVAGTTKQIAQITGVPPEMLYELTEAKYNASIEQQGSFVVRYTFRPWITQIEGELTLKLLTDSEQEDGFTVHLNPDALLRGSSKEQMDVVAQGVNAGIYTPNEGRDYVGQPRLADPEANKVKRLGDTSPAAASQ